MSLTLAAFARARAEFGKVRHVGRKMPRDLPKSWTYMHKAWNDIMRTPVTGVIEAVAEGDDKVFTSLLFGQKNAKLRLTLPDLFDAQVHKVAALVKHYLESRCTCQHRCYEPCVHYTPSKSELERIREVLKSRKPTELKNGPCSVGL